MAANIIKANAIPKVNFMSMKNDITKKPIWKDGFLRTFLLDRSREEEKVLLAD